MAMTQKNKHTSDTAQETLDDEKRLSAVADARTFRGKSTPVLDGLTTAAAAILDVPIALISIVDEKEQWFASRCGLATESTAREVSFCQHVVVEKSPLIVSDATQDERFHDNPLVLGEPHIRSYFGVPLETPDGQVLGSLCGIGRSPKEIEPEKLVHLKSLADAVISHLELEKNTRELRGTQATVDQHWHFFEHSLDLHCVAGTDGFFQRLNRRWEKLLGWSMSELLERPFLHFVHPEDHERTVTAFNTLRDSTDVLEFRNRYQSKDGSYLWLEWNAFPMPDGTTVNASARDVTHIVERETNLRASSKKLTDHLKLANAILAETPSVIYAKDPSLRFILSNRKHANLLGCMPDDILGKSDRELLGDDADEIEEMSRQVLQTGLPHDSEFTLPIQGEDRTYHEVVFPIHDENGEALGLAGIASDLTENRKHLQSLQRFGESLEQILRDSPVALMLVDTSCRIEMANSAALRIASRDELKGVLVTDVLEVDAERISPQSTCAGTASAESASRDVMLRLPDASLRPAEMRSTHVQLPAGEFTVVSLVDLTLRKELEARLDEARLQAVASARAKGSFLANMSHEIRTPMNAVLGFAQLLFADKSLTESQREKIRTILKAGDHLLSLVNQVLDMSVIESGQVELHREPVYFQELVKGVGELFVQQAQSRGLQLQVEVAPGVPVSFYGDTGKLRQILVNLVGNAIRVTAQGAVHLRGDVLRRGAQLELVVQVRDTGPGISKTDLERIFSPFEQAGTAKQRGGAGLGLAISRKYASLFGGELRAESVLGEGATFELRMPIEPAEAKTPPKRTFSTAHALWATSGADKRVLVVDDHKENRDFTCETLRKVDFATAEATTGDDAILQMENESFDLVILDYRMPGKNGLETAKMMRTLKNGAAVPILMLSASVFDGLHEKMTDYGINSFVAKPASPAELLSAVFELLRIQTNKQVAQKQDPERPTGVKQNVSPALKAHLLDAAQDSDYGTLMELLHDLREQSPDLADEFTEMANSFAYASIIERLG